MIIKAPAPGKATGAAWQKGRNFRNHARHYTTISVTASSM